VITKVIRAFSQIRPYLSLLPFDTSTPEGRAQERQRRAVLSTLMAMAAKVVTVSTMLVTVPLTLKYLGTERYGMWMTMSSFIAMLGFADLGIGNGLLNAISESNGRDDISSMRRYISSAAVVLTMISVVIFAVFLSLYQTVEWSRIFNVHTPLAIAEAGPATLVFMLCFVINIPATIVQRVQLGLQMGFISNIWQAAGSVMALAAVLIAVHLHAGLYWLVFAFAGSPIVAVILNGLVFFLRSRGDLRPRISLATSQYASRVMRTGLLFFVLQIGVAVAYLSDNAIIAHILGASAVSDYAVPDKMFSAIPVLITMIMMPLWPAYGEAIARGDGTWVRKILKKSLMITFLVSAPISLCLVVFGPEILTLWVGHAVNPSLLLLLGLGTWKVLEAVGNGFAIFLNGANVVRLQVVLTVVMSSCAMALKFTLIPLIGVSGAVWATILAYSFFVMLPYLIYIPKVLDERVASQKKSPQGTAAVQQNSKSSPRIDT